ncbi:hypothetical protein ABTX35_18900 [Streptomyces sp. NPDC096080]|uniref:hypothetical protein n=1 Tax=Streptomyces sp. NPDC096080 TaxID=3156693 RepID=UPI00331BAA3B
MPDLQLVCLDEEHAAAVVAEATRPGDADHTVREDGPVVVITYYDKRYALDIADWAGAYGHATDSAAAHLISQL